MRLVYNNSSSIIYSPIQELLADVGEFMVVGELRAMWIVSSFSATLTDRRRLREDKTGVIFIRVLKRKTISMKGKTGALINFFNKDNGGCFFRSWNEKFSISSLLIQLWGMSGNVCKGGGMSYLADGKIFYGLSDAINNKLCMAFDSFLLLKEFKRGSKERMNGNI